VSAPTAAERAQVIAGLRELADLLDAHPELPVETSPDVCVHAGPVDPGTDDEDEDAKRAVVDQAAAVLGTPLTDHEGHYETTWKSQGEDPYNYYRVKYRVLSITKASMRAHEARQSYDANLRAGGAR
jgi:hypothetical protein